MGTHMRTYSDSELRTATSPDPAPAGRQLPSPFPLTPFSLPSSSYCIPSRFPLRVVNQNLRLLDDNSRGQVGAISTATQALGMQLEALCGAIAGPGSASVAALQQKIVETSGTSPALLKAADAIKKGIAGASTRASSINDVSCPPITAQHHNRVLHDVWYCTIAQCSSSTIGALGTAPTGPVHAVHGCS